MTARGGPSVDERTTMPTVTVKAPWLLDSVLNESDFRSLQSHLQATDKSAMYYDAVSCRYLMGDRDPILKQSRDRLVPLAREVFGSNTLIPSYALFAHMRARRRTCSVTGTSTPAHTRSIYASTRRPPGICSWRIGASRCSRTRPRSISATTSGTGVVRFLTRIPHAWRWSSITSSSPTTGSTQKDRDGKSRIRH